MTIYTRSIQIPFEGFYNSYASDMIDQEIEQCFDYSDGGGSSNIPDDLYYKFDYSAVQADLVRAWADAWASQFESETGIAFPFEFDEMVSPREYNFETDRVFVKTTDLFIASLFTASEADNHTHLAALIKESCTSRSGFISYYSNDLGAWLMKPIGSWDHNELKILLEAVLAIHYTEPMDYGAFETYTLLEDYRGNGDLSNAVWDAMPQPFRDFAAIQREYGKAVDYDLFVSTGKAFENGTPYDDIESELPLPRCTQTLELPLGGKHA